MGTLRTPLCGLDVAACERAGSPAPSSASLTSQLREIPPSPQTRISQTVSRTLTCLRRFPGIKKGTIHIFSHMYVLFCLFVCLFPVAGIFLWAKSPQSIITVPRGLNLLCSVVFVTSRTHACEFQHSSSHLLSVPGQNGFNSFLRFPDSSAEPGLERARLGRTQSCHRRPNVSPTSSKILVSSA